MVQVLEVLDEATIILTSSLQESTAAIPEMAKVAYLYVAEALFRYCNEQLADVRGNTAINYPLVGSF